MKHYTSFEEIETDLKYLRLKSKIDKEEFKLSIRNAKDTISETFSPINLIAGTVGAFIKRAFYLKVVNKIFGLTGKRH